MSNGVKRVERLLINRPTPYGLETLTSYLARLALANRYPGPSWIEALTCRHVWYAKVAVLLRLNPGISFCYCSAAGADGGSRWARVRRRVEGELKVMPFRHVGGVRPGFIQPGPGIRSSVKLYQAFLTICRPLFPLMVRAIPSAATTSARLGRAMLRVVQGRADRFILESADINHLGL